MPTSVHIPPPLLAAVDRKARVLGISRNRFIIGALQRELSPGAAWSPGFFQQLAVTDADTAHAVDEMRDAIAKARKSKRPARL